MGVVPESSVPHLNISVNYWPIWMKLMAFNQKFYIDYVSITFKSTTPLLGDVALGRCGTWELCTSFNISVNNWPIWMKLMSFNQKFDVDYIFITSKSATPLLGGVAPESCVPHLNISVNNWPIWMKLMSFNQKFDIDYIFITSKSATPLLGGVVLDGCGTWELCASFKYLSQLLTDLDETNGIQSEILHRLHIYHI